MKKLLKRFTLSLIVLLLGISISGCGAAVLAGAGAAGGYYYRKGQEKKGEAPKPASSYSTGTTSSK